MAIKNTAKKQIALLKSAKNKKVRVKVGRVRAKIKALGLAEADVKKAIRWARGR